MSNYPVMLNLKNKQVVIVGGGTIGTRKVKGLIGTEAKIRVVSPSFSSELLNIVEIERRKKNYSVTDIEDAFLIFICTDNPFVNQQIRNDVASHQLLNDTTDQQNSNFHNMAHFLYNDAVIGISTNGKSPHYAKKIKEKLHSYLSNKS